MTSLKGARKIIIMTSQLVKSLTIVSALLWFSAGLCEGLAIEMKSRPEVFTQEEHSGVEMKCHFVSEDFKLFDNPIVWRKRQGGEESQVNMMGNLLEPFPSTRRYRATYSPEHPVHVFQLNIQDLTLEDSGNYTCEVSGPQNSVVASLTHQVYIRAHVESIVISTAGNETTLIGEQKYLKFIEGQPTDLICTVIGGYPPPDVDVYLGNTSADEKVIPGFELNRSLQLTGQKGLRRIHYTTVWTVQQFVPQSLDDSSEMRCVATVHGLESTHVRATVLVQYAPVIECDTTEVEIGDRNVALRCLVRARPPLSHSYWIIDNNGTTVSEGEVVNEHWQLIMDLTNGQYEMQLFTRHVTAQSFRNYTLHAENNVSSRTASVTFTHRSPRIRANSTRHEGHPSKQEAAQQSYTSGSSAILNDIRHLTLYSQSKLTLLFMFVLLHCPIGLSVTS